MVTTAVIMAAGKGTRFGKMTETLPKGFIEFNGVPMIVRSIENLLSCGIKNIIIGTGYHKEFYDRLTEKYPNIVTVFSERYAETNSMYTLYNCRKTIGTEDFLLLESDLVYERKALTCLIEDGHPDIMLITPVTKFQDQYYIERDTLGFLSNCSIDKSQLTPSGELVGIHKLSNSFYQEMCADYGSMLSETLQMGYEYELLRMAKKGKAMYVRVEEGLHWYEIDDIKDLQFAQMNVEL